MNNEHLLDISSMTGIIGQKHLPRKKLRPYGVTSNYGNL